MYEYEISGTTYYAQGDRLYVAEEEPHKLEDLDSQRVYLYEGAIVKLYDDGDTFTSIEVSPVQSDSSRHVAKEKFEQAWPLSSVVPEGIEECPNCGSWAGDADDKGTPKCFRCGHGAGVSFGNQNE